MPDTTKDAGAQNQGEGQSTGTGIGGESQHGGGDIGDIGIIDDKIGGTQGRQGETVPDTPNKKRTHGKRLCWNCRLPGHFRRDCPVICPVICFKCRRPGHFQSDCPVICPVICSKCRGLGHFQSDCPGCRLCGLDGHSTGNCPRYTSHQPAVALGASSKPPGCRGYIQDIPRLEAWILDLTDEAPPPAADAGGYECYAAALNFPRPGHEGWHNRPPVPKPLHVLMSSDKNWQAASWHGTDCPETDDEDGRRGRQNRSRDQLSDGRYGYRKRPHLTQKQAEEEDRSEEMTSYRTFLKEWHDSTAGRW